VSEILMSIEADIFVRVLLNESASCSNASIMEAIAHKHIELHGLSLNSREVALRRTN
jgi:hypothetical protein